MFPRGPAVSRAGTNLHGPRHETRANDAVSRKLRRWIRGGRSRRALHLILVGPMAKDTEKLIRQLSLISFLMAERRPVSAL
jgi:hypothetical protein